MRDLGESSVENCRTIYPLLTQLHCIAQVEDAANAAFGLVNGLFRQEFNGLFLLTESDSDSNSLHCTMQKFFHRTDSDSDLDPFPEWLLFPFWGRISVPRTDLCPNYIHFNQGIRV